MTQQEFWEAIVLNLLVGTPEQFDEPDIISIADVLANAHSERYSAPRPSGSTKPDDMQTILSKDLRACSGMPLRVSYAVRSFADPPVRTLGEFVRLSEDDVRQYNGIGPRTMIQVKDYLATLGLSLGMNPTP